MSDGTVICPVMDARRSQVYNALFVFDGERMTRLCDDRLITAEELFRELNSAYCGKRIILVGDGAFVAKGVFDKLNDGVGIKYEIAFGGVLYEDAFSVACAAIDHINEWQTSDGKLKIGEYSGKALSPTYLRASQAERERKEKEATKI